MRIQSLPRFLLILTGLVMAICVTMMVIDRTKENTTYNTQGMIVDSNYDELALDVERMKGDLKQLRDQVFIASEMIDTIKRVQKQTEGLHPKERTDSNIKSDKRENPDSNIKSVRRENVESEGKHEASATAVQRMATKSNAILKTTEKIELTPNSTISTDVLPLKQSSLLSSIYKTVSKIFNYDKASPTSSPFVDNKMSKDEEQSRVRPKDPGTACKIPAVDPFSPVVMKYIKKLPMTQCRGVTVGHIKDGHLKFNLKHVKSVVLINVKRDNDFWMDYSDFVSFTNRTEERKLNHATNRIGCIATKHHGHVDQKLKLTNKQCIVPHFFKFTPDGRLRIMEKSNCISFTGSKEKDMLTLDKNCTSVGSEFFFSEDGSIKNIASGLCLHVANLAEKKEEYFLTLSGNCSSENSRFVFLEPLVEDVLADIPVTNDCIKLMTLFENNSLHVEFHLHAATIPDKDLPKTKMNNIQNKLNPDVAILLFDSQSAANFKRLLPKTSDFLHSDERSFVFKGNTIVGDGTTPQVTAMLTGHKITDLPEGRRSMPNTYFIDRWPFIFKELHDHGYITLMAEDDPVLGAFHLRLWGFLDQPTTHYGRAYWVAAMADQPSYLHSFSCIGDKFLHRINMDYLLSLYRTNPDRNKFSIILTSHICHNEFNGIQYTDADILDILEQTRGNGLLNNTILLILGDHGSRYGPLRESIQGKIEERLPFLSMTLPDRMLKEFPDLIDSLRRNTELLTSHFDLFATFKHILSYPSLPSGVKFGNSLFSILNETRRTCENIGVPERWCPCLEFQEMNTSDRFARKVAERTVSHINGLISKRKETEKKCSKLELDTIVSVRKKIPNKRVQNYLYSDSDSSCATCAVVETNQDTFHDSLYEVTIKVAPSGGLFEATLHLYDDELIHVHADISRINKYGIQSKCIETAYPHLRKFCYCNEQ